MTSNRHDSDLNGGGSASVKGDGAAGQKNSRMQSDLLSALGKGAVNRRMTGRMMGRQTDIADNDILKRLALRVDQIFAGLISCDQRFLDAITHRLLREEVEFSSFYRQIAVPVAQRLGEAWTDDSVTMVDVEFAMSRLTLWCEKYASEDPQRIATTGSGRRIFLARTPGEAHTLGLSIVAKCYRHAGWMVDGGAHVEAGRELFSVLRDTHYDVVGVSVGVSHRAPHCAALVGQIRDITLNKNLKVGLGGPGLVADPLGFDDVGADFLALDAVEAVEVCDRFVRAA